MSNIVITGCSTGFGHDAAERFASRGHQVFATMRNVDGKNADSAAGLRTVAEENDWALHVVELDVADEDSVRAAAATVLDQVGAPDVVINNAGIMFVGVTEAYTPEEFNWQLDVNVLGVHRVCRAFLPAMRAQGSGLIMNVSSVAGRIATPFMAVYNASKWALEGYSLGLRREIAQTGVDVVVVEPGPFTTELFPQAPAPEDREGRIGTYPEVVRQTLEGLGEAFQGMFDDPEVPTDPSLVVDRFVELVEMEPGTRPFRSPVGVDLGVSHRNADDEKHEPPLLEAFGMTEFATLRTG